MKRNLLIAVSVAAVIILGWFVWRFVSPSEPQRDLPLEQGTNFFPTENGSTAPATVNGFGTSTPNSASLAPENNSTAPELPAYRRFTAAPITGAVAFGTRNSSKLRYMDTQSGNIFETNYASTSATRITKTTLIKGQDSFWSNTGNNLLVRIVEAGNIFTQGFSINSSSGALEKRPRTIFNKTILEVVPSPNANSFAYLTLENDGSSSVTIEETDKGAGKPIFSSPVSEWNISWPNSSTLLLTTKASHEVPGYTYTINTQNGAQRRLLGGVPGLNSLLSPKGTTLLYSSTAGNDIFTGLLNLTTQETRPFSVATLAEKCLWSKDNVTIWCAAPNGIPSAEYPDSWYKGLTSFSDSIWYINTQTGASGILFAPENEGVGQVDAVKLMTDPDENYLYFTNKRDGTLWGVALY